MLTCRYPLHFHLCGSVPDNVVRKNSVHNSLQRCYNVHATHNMTLEDNFAFNTTGHCFILEDGIEMGNTFLHNLGLVNKAPYVLIPPQNVAETDDENTIFWCAGRWALVSGRCVWSPMGRTRCQCRFLLGVTAWNGIASTIST